MQRPPDKFFASRAAYENSKRIWLEYVVSQHRPGCFDVIVHRVNPKQLRNVLPDYGPPRDIDYIMYFRQFMRLPESASRFGRFCPGLGWPTTREVFERAWQEYTNPKREGMHFNHYQWLPKKPGIYCYEPQPIKSAI